MKRELTSLLTAAAVVVVTSGCYTYQTVNPASVEPGRDVRVRLSLEAADRLESWQLEPAWRRVTLRSLTRTYRTPRVFDEQVKIRDYGDKPIRQLSILDLCC